MGTQDDFVPQDHLVRKLEEFIDWYFIYEICDRLYSNKGTNRIDSVVLFKMMFINIIFGIHSMKKTCEAIKVNTVSDRHGYILEMILDTGKVPDSTAPICHEIYKDDK